jgi:hypothetical protein
MDVSHDHVVFGPQIPFLGLKAYFRLFDPQMYIISCYIWNFRSMTDHNHTGSFSEESDKIGRGFSKILETWEFGLSFNIIRHVFFCFGQKSFFVGFMNFWKILKKNRKITFLGVNNAFFNRFSWLSTFFQGNLVIFVIFIAFWEFL